MVMPRSYRDNLKLTGNVRNRLGWRGKLIVQVEESFTLHSWVDFPPSQQGKVFTHWRDATIEDYAMEIK